MSTDDLAESLLDAAVDDEQVAHRIVPSDDVPSIRAAVRRLARSKGVMIRTAVIDGVLVVVRADAKVWTDTTAEMRRKLSPSSPKAAS